MDEVIIALEDIRKEYDSEINNGGIILGEAWLDKAKAKLKKCLIAARITRKVIATAAQEQIKLIVTIFSPIFTNSEQQKIDKENLDLLKIIIQNKISIYSLTGDWLIEEKGGFDYLLKLLDFKYSSKIAFNDEPIKTYGRIGERKKKFSYIDLLKLLQQHFDSEIRYLGYNQLQIQRIAIVTEITNIEDVYSLHNNSKIDVTLVGDISYEGLLVAKFFKLPLVILGRRNLENIVIGNISRRLMEEITITLPEIVLFKQDEIGTVVDD
ncbi:MAG: Nif3-like dinuclear metal center hexameric protein [Candidatus Heimdallarchaeota archaeon]